VITKQKYKRSEQVRSLLDNKKMSSSGKERRDTDNSGRLMQTRDADVGTTNKTQFKEINLSTIINSNTGKDYEITLDDTLYQEVGEMSYRNLLMMAAVLFEQGKFNDVIMYVGRVLEKTEGNLFLVKLPGP
jgi:hypothetical protein